jgi:outer membrane protein OmpA-like peptidoglycan-associated protein
MHSKSNVLLAASLVMGAAALAGCGGTIEFQGKAPIAVVGNPPAPPPPPKVEAPPPPEEPKRVVVKADKIEINEKIQFELNSHVIKPESYSLMDEITKVVQDHPEIKKVAIEGHASSDGDDNANLALSDRRSKSVMDYLVKKGVKQERLQAKGFGEQKPIADNGTEEGRVKNRRVEFNILERDKK